MQVAIKFNLFSRLGQLFLPSPAAKAAPHFAIPAGTRVYAVGDIHGRDALLNNMLEAIRQDAQERPVEKVIEIFLGDYVDRGMHSKEVIDLLLAPPPAGHERICLMGNHEEVMLRFLSDSKILRDWGNFGGYATLSSYGIDIPPSMSPETMNILRDTLQKTLPPEHLAFLQNLPLSYSLGNYLFVHAGILPGVPLEEQKPTHLLWIRDSFLNYESFFDYYVVHGHTPLMVPDLRHNRANLDVSAAEISSLCCLVIQEDTQALLTVTKEND